MKRFITNPRKRALSDWPQMDSGCVCPSGTAATRLKVELGWRFPWQLNAQPCSWQTDGGWWRGRRDQDSAWRAKSQERMKEDFIFQRTPKFVFGRKNIQITYEELSVMRGISIKLTTSPAKFTKVSWIKNKKRVNSVNLSCEPFSGFRRSLEKKLNVWKWPDFHLWQKCQPYCPCEPDERSAQLWLHLQRLQRWPKEDKCRQFLYSWT